MAVVDSIVDVANLALDEIGEQSVSNVVNPTTKEEVKVSRQIDRSRRYVLRKGAWNFAKRYYTASLQATAPPNTYTDSYKLPGDLIRLLVVGGETEASQITNYDIAGRNLYINNEGGSSVNVQYITDVTDLKLWTPDALDAWIYRLALNLAIPFSKSEEMVKRLQQQYDDVMPGAQSIDGQERPPRRIQRSKYRDARFRNSTPGYIVDFENP